MATSIHWGNKIINVLRADLALIQSVPTEIRQLNLDTFRKELKDLEDDPEGMSFVDTHQHNTTVEVGGVILGRVVEIINGYTVTFEDGQYAVNLVGANSNVGDVVNVNQVSVRSANSAGLQDLSTLLASAYQGRVVLDSILGQPGTDVPIGTYKTPSDNMVDTLNIAIDQGLNEIFLTRNLTINEDLSAGYNIVGGSPFFVITANPIADLTGCSITNLTIQGELDGLNVVKQCRMMAVTNVNGIFEKVSFASTVAINGSTNIYECYSAVEGLGYPIFTVTSGDLIIRDYKGSLGLSGITSGIHSVGINDEGRLVIDSTCTGGSIYLRGKPYEVIDNSGAGCNVVNQTESGKVTAIWDGTSPGSTVGGDAGWDVIIPVTPVVGSYGEWVKNDLLSEFKFNAYK